MERTASDRTLRADANCCKGHTVSEGLSPFTTESHVATSRNIYLETVFSSSNAKESLSLIYSIIYESATGFSAARYLYPLVCMAADTKCVQGGGTIVALCWRE